MMNIKKLWRNAIYITTTILPVLLAGCNLPGSVPPTSQDAIYTEAAQTMIVQMTQSAPAVQPTGTQPPVVVVLDTPTATQPLLPTDTPTLEFTATPAFTATSTTPMIRATTGTNCRLGPSKLYDPPVGFLDTNQSVPVYGRNSNSTWWYIQNPQRPKESCWVWGETTRVDGNTTALPVITPPPMPPTPTFTVTPGAIFKAGFVKVRTCGEPTAIFEILNSGTVALQSLALKIEDITSGTTLFGTDISNAPFMSTSSECPPGGDMIPSGKTMFIGGAIGSGGSGHTARATIKLCTKDDLEGLCAQKTVEFTIP